MGACVRACVRVCMCVFCVCVSSCACARACVRLRVRACVCLSQFEFIGGFAMLVRSLPGKSRKEQVRGVTDASATYAVLFMTSQTLLAKCKIDGADGRALETSKSRFFSQSRLSINRKTAVSFLLRYLTYTEAIYGLLVTGDGSGRREGATYE